MRENRIGEYRDQALNQPLVSEASIRQPLTPPETSFYDWPVDRQEREELALTRMQEGVDKLLEDPKGYFRLMARFPRYSLANTFMIFAQFPEASLVMGYGDKTGKTGWKSVGRHVREGETGIRIWAPNKYKVIDEETGDPKEIVRNFRLVSVFDVSQTEGEPLPDPPSITEDVTTDDVSTAINLKLSRFCIDNGLIMSSEPMEGHRRGSWSPQQRKIALRASPDVSPFSVSRTKTLVHETAHFLANHDGTVGREDAEQVAEITAYVVMNRFGHDTSDASFGYVAGWGGTGEKIHTKLGEVKRLSGEIIAAIETIGDPYADDFGSFDQADPWAAVRDQMEIERLADSYVNL
jgi:hypothetical protein